MIECDEYVKSYSDHKEGFKVLNLKIIKGKHNEVYRDMVFDNPNAHIDFFIENNDGKTIESFTYQDKKINT